MSTQTATLPASVLTKKQTKDTDWKQFTETGIKHRIRAFVRYDDECGNGHNTFAITGQIQEIHGSRWVDSSFGMLHDEIGKRFPQIALLLKWHLCSSDGPMHYIANTLYHIKQGNLDYARSSAVWPEAADADLLDDIGNVKARLAERLPALMQEFKAAVESLGLVY
jgi:hypothetical protein